MAHARSVSSPCSKPSRLARAQFNVPQNRIARARNLVLDQRATAGTEELPEYGPVVDVAPVVADVRVGRADVRLVPHAVILVVIAQGSEVGSALCTSRAQTFLLAPQVEIVG